MTAPFYLNRSALRFFVPAFCLAFVLIGFGVYLGTTPVRAGSLLNASDLIDNGSPGVVTTHTITYTSETSTASGESIRITFDPQTDLFGNVGSVVMGDITFTGASLVASCGVGPGEVQLTTSTAPGDNSVIFTVCAGQTVASGTKTIVIANRLSNPTTTGSYVVRIAGTQPDSQDVRVAIIPPVVVSAGVDSSLTFTVNGVSSSVTINGVTTTYDSTPTSLPFGSLTIGVPTTLGQALSVVTNAAHGFSVTVHEDQDLSNGAGADINLFPDGLAYATPTDWASPSSTFGVDTTYGHFGVTSDDSDLGGGEYISAKFAGHFQPTSTQTVFSHNGPADGITQDKGAVKVAYRVEIGPLQEGGALYSNDLFYVATPVF
ncbi:MAG TPA: hypothetical protein VMC43_00415 [Candidatus Paceibacterota bacterium]|nr:hypothetical protein [Candidatus Paceibacterota bacterium]